MSEKLHEVIKLLSNNFRKKFDDYKGLYLFGAHVSGEDSSDQDIEIVAIFEGQNKAKREKIWPIIGEIETQLSVSIDLYPYTNEEFKNDKELYEEVIAHGIFYTPLGIAKKL